MNMTYVTILNGNIDDNLWPEIILAIIQIKNVRPISLLEDKNPYKVHFSKALDINHLQVLGSTVYVLIYKEERNLKSEKFKARALKGTLVKYDKYTIYRVFIQSQDKIIWVKDF